MPDWPDLLDAPPVPIAHYGTAVVVEPRRFYVQQAVSAEVLASPPAVADRIWEQLQHALTAEMFKQNFVPVGDATLDWEREPTFDAWRYTISQQGIPAEARWQP